MSESVLVGLQEASFVPPEYIWLTATSLPNYLVYRGLVYMRSDAPQSEVPIYLKQPEQFIITRPATPGVDCPVCPKCGHVFRPVVWKPNDGREYSPRYCRTCVERIYIERGYMRMSLMKWNGEDDE